MSWTWCPPLSSRQPQVPSSACRLTAGSRSSTLKPNGFMARGVMKCLERTIFSCSYQSLFVAKSLLTCKVLIPGTVAPAPDYSRAIAAS